MPACGWEGNRKSGASTTETVDEVDESSIHDILDGYHSEDNIDDDDDAGHQ